MVRVAVVGASGYAGAELVRILSGHPRVDLTVLTSRQHAGQRIDGLYPALTGCCELPLETFEADELCRRAEVVFTALPHQLPMAVVPLIIERGRRVVDLSADFRFQDAARYEAAYQPHGAPELLARSVYGLSEVYTERIRTAEIVGNPGCYPTSVLLPLVPLLRSGLVSPDGLVADAKSGVSGAGRAAALATQFCEVNESFRPYKVAAHRHCPEMEAVLGREAGAEVALTFVPHLVPMNRGIQTTIYARPAPGATAGDIEAALADAYRGRPFVRLRPQGHFPDVRHVRGTNFCDIGFVLEARTGRLILMSAIDNLVKGAAGQAVQNMNIMLGFDETEGLTAAPMPV